MPMAAVIATLTSIVFKVEAFSWNVVVGGVIITASIVISGVFDAINEKKIKAKEEVNNEQDQCL